MKDSDACPYCGAAHARVLADHAGMVGWCRVCHRTWVINSRPTTAHLAQPRGDQQREHRRVA